MRERIWILAAAAAVPLLAAYATVSDPVVREGMWLALLTGVTAGAVVSIAVHRPPVRRPWRLLLTALFLLLVTNIIEFPGWDAGVALRTVASTMELAAFPLFGLSMLDVVRRKTPNGDREGAIDGLIVMVAGAALLSGTVFTPAVLDERTPVAYALLVVAPLVLAGVMTAALRLLLVGGRKVAGTWFLVGAAACGLGGHVVRSLAQAAGTYSRGDPGDLLIGLAYVFIGLAALHPSMLVLTDPAPPPERRLTHGRVVVLGLALLAAPVTLIVGSNRVVPLVAAVVVSLLVFLRLWRLVIEREAVGEDMRRRATHDPLTGLPNRAFLLDRLDHMLSRRSADPLPDAVLFIDLDGFKRANDDFGHAAGDEVLIEVARRLSAVSRPSDLLARLAGDEFVLVCERIAEHDTVRLAERLLDALDTPIALDGAQVRLGASIGVAFDSTTSTSAEALLGAADAAMYQAKQRGNSYEVYGVELGERLHRRRRLEVDLLGAIERGELRLAYQPIVTLQTKRRIIGFEALLRWTHPALGAISPPEAVAAAEATGQLVPLGSWVLREACFQLARVNATRPVHDQLAMYVNVSSRELLDPRMAERVAGILAATGVAPDQVVLEVTEHAALEADGHGTITLHELRALGVHVALDDFGTGYSSLTHLQQVPFDFIKIDASFTKDLEQEVENQVIVEAIVGVAARLGRQVIGEGIEYRGQLAWLQRLGCQLGQGWMLGYPVDDPATALAGQGRISASR